MNICVFGAASNEIDKKYMDDIEIMAEQLAKDGHHLVFGAGGQGLMGAAARGFKKGGAKITGVIPTFFKEAEIEAIYDECDELIYTDTMRERKAVMEDKADAFVIVPGGIGTFEELFEVLTLKQLGRHSKPIAIYNCKGYYDKMEAMLNTSIEEGFVRHTCKEIYSYVNNVDELIRYINNNNHCDYTVSELKA